MKTIYLIVTLIAIQISNNVFCQNNTDTTSEEKIYVVTKNDGTEYIGKILLDDGREVLIETETLGKIYLPKSDIRSMILIENKGDIIYGDFRNEGPFTTRYAFTTNALPIKKGENYALVNLYGPEVHFAVSNKLNIGVMSTWIASPMVLALKYSMKTKNEKVNFSIGTLMGTSGYLGNFRGFGGLHFANVTFGDRKNNLTLAAGYGYLQNVGYSYGPTQEAVVYNNDYSYYYSGRSKVPMTKGLIFSVAGIASVGAKASFVFDSMIGIMNTDAYSTTTTEINPATYDSYGNYTPGYYRHDTKLVERQSIAMFIMPGMRFQKSEDKAFQVSLAGVSLFRTKGWNNYYGNGTISFPFPMCSWFFKF